MKVLKSYSDVASENARVTLRKHGLSFGRVISAEARVFYRSGADDIFRYLTAESCVDVNLVQIASPVKKEKTK